MARINGVDLPREKRVEIGLTYIFGIGRTRATKICAETGVDPSTRVKDLTEDEVTKIRDFIDANYTTEGSSPRGEAERLPSDGDRLLPWPPSPQGPACPWPAYAHQRSHPQGQEASNRWQEEVGQGI